jgi:membrane protease YdiL (CAAX protease family)
MNGSFSDKNAALQFLLVIGLCVLGLAFSALVGGVLTSLFFDVSAADLQDVLTDGDSTLGKELSKFLQGIMSIGLFLLPALVAAKFLSWRPAHYLGTDTFPSSYLLLIGLLGLLTLSSLGISDILYRFTKAIPLPESLVEAFNEQEVLMQSQYELFLEMPTVFAFVKAFLLIAILPAICEETLFRGVLQPIFKKGTRNVHIAVWLTAACFAVVHFNYYSMLSIFILGAVLGYLREWTGSLWVSILLHLLNNGIIVCAIYFGDISLSELSEGGLETDGVGFSALSVVSFVVLLWLIRKSFGRLPEPR